jgi:hypothetical protein
MYFQEITNKLLSADSQTIREQQIKLFLAQGIFPKWINENLSKVVVSDGLNILEYFVYNDYLCLGNETEWFHCPMSPLTALDLMTTHNLLLPTPKMVQQIYRTAKIKPRAVSWGELYKSETKKYNRDSTKCYLDHSKKIQEQMKQVGWIPGDLVAGHKKDVVLTNLLSNPKYKNNVAIYGWFNSDGTIIQNLNGIDHVVSYVDYSHGLRMIKNNCILNGNQSKLTDLFDDKNLCKLVHDEPLKFKTYGK